MNKRADSDSSFGLDDDEVVERLVEGLAGDNAQDGNKDIPAEWYYVESNLLSEKVCGPITLEELETRIQSGSFDGKTLVANRLMTNNEYKQIESIEFLRPALIDFENKVEIQNKTKQKNRENRRQQITTDRKIYKEEMRRRFPLEVGDKFYSNLFWVSLCSIFGFICVAIVFGVMSQSNDSVTKKPRLNGGRASTRDPDKAASSVLSRLNSTSDGRAAVERLGNKDQLLSRFQKENGISERIAEASIKEWVLTHGGDFDWNLDEVKVICLRNKRSGIPNAYLPESEK